ncbi:D-alanyl-D-alanine carboxypeptidase family protein [bacterium 1XD42-8]|nr:D-alanyl-D-alanine carboxypeptidase family protein [bacterium 1XD42-8]
MRKNSFFPKLRNTIVRCRYVCSTIIAALFCWGFSLYTEEITREQIIQAKEAIVEVEIEEARSADTRQVSENKISASVVKETREQGSEADSSSDLEEDWKLMLISKREPVPLDYTFELGMIQGEIRADIRILEEANEMLKEARKEGIFLVICSPYRDYDRQEMLFNQKVKSYMEQGMSFMEAYIQSSHTIAVPGASEHQVGLALDIVCSTHYRLDEAFGDTEAGKWLAENSYQYGFILRYPKDKEEITGIEYEPWHFRYVGKEAAKEMTEQKLTLEEYVEQVGT